MSQSERAVSYAALILADENLEITADKLQTILKGANVEVEAIWTSLFSKALDGKDVKELLLNVGSGGGAGATPAAGAGVAADSAAVPAEEKKEEKEEAKEESDEDMGFGLFD